LFATLTAASIAHRVRPVDIGAYPFRAGLVIGGLCIAIAVALGAWAIAEMKRHGTTIHPGETPTRLVTSGPFRFTRNPLYLTHLFFIAGVALAMNSLWFLAGVVVQALLLDRLIIVREESVIRERFGDEYGQYVRAVRRWI
jgi:protein-S-isoprenylcysteine O-methyltransferase Ste14